MNTSSSNAHSTGHMIGGGRYSLHVPLGESDLVWLAQDEVEQRLVVIRFLPADVRSDARAFNTLKGRFARAVSIKHRNLCGLIELYEGHGVEPFAVTEYLEGKSLPDALGAARGKAVSWEQLQPVASEMARGMAALHAAGLVHQGITPENGMVTGDGAKLLNTVITGVLRNPTFVPSALKAPASLRWFSPQQMAGENPAAADDYYSFGATLYELLTGIVLFADSKSILGDIRNASVPDIRTRLPDGATLPSSVADFIMACLSKDAAHRPVSFAALDREQAPKAQAVRITSPSHVSNVLPVVAESEIISSAELTVLKQTRVAVRQRSKLPWLAAAACIVVCAVAGGGIWLLKQNAAEKKRLTTASAAAVQEAERLRQVADDQKRQVAVLEQKTRQETEARQRADAELKRKEEMARVAAAEADRRQVHAPFQADPSVQLISTSKTVSGPLVASAGEEGFVSLFNGRDLSGWTGDTQHWSVVDGLITGQVKAEEPAHKRHYLVCDKGTVENFEIQFAYRFRILRGNKQPNGGVLYRATTNSNTELLSAYQFDVTPETKNAGAVIEDKKRNRLSGFGESSIARANDKSEVIEQIGDTNKLSAIRPEDWNQCVVIARGNHLTHYINGLLAADLIDENVKKQHKSGMLTLELYARNTNNPVTFLQFREIKLKRLPKDSSLASAH